MKEIELPAPVEAHLCERLSGLLCQGRDMLHAGKVDAYYGLLPEIDKAITELSLRVKKWGKSKKLALGTPWKRDLLERFKGLQEAACESERLAHRSLEITFNGLMQLSQMLTPTPTYTPRPNERVGHHTILLDRQA
ncbi:MAG: hypothetical protein FJY66_05085 [Calditrichaeota bacterium]|nr:hypothetical protein [Calditrichota bacterium]